LPQRRGGEELVNLDRASDEISLAVDVA